MHNCILFHHLTHCEALKMCRSTDRLYWQPSRYEMQTCNFQQCAVWCLAVNWIFRGHWPSFFFRAPLHRVTSKESLRFQNNRQARCNINKSLLAQSKTKMCVGAWIYRYLSWYKGKRVWWFPSWHYSRRKRDMSGLAFILFAVRFVANRAYQIPQSGPF